MEREKANKITGWFGGVGFFVCLILFGCVVGFFVGLFLVFFS